MKTDSNYAGQGLDGANRSPVLGGGRSTGSKASLKRTINENLKERMESALQRENSHQPVLHQQSAMDNKLGNTGLVTQTNPSGINQRPATHKNSLNISQGAGASRMIGSVQLLAAKYPTQADIRGDQPKVTRESTSDSEYHVPAFPTQAKSKGHHSNANDSITQQQQMQVVPKEMAANKHQRNTSQIQIDAEINPYNEYSKDAQSLSPVTAAASHQMLSNRLNHVDKWYYSKNKSPSMPDEQMSGPTAENSFIEAPPIPYNRKYMADVQRGDSQYSGSKLKYSKDRLQQPSSGRTGNFWNLSGDVKFRKHLPRPEQQLAQTQVVKNDHETASNHDSKTSIDQQNNDQKSEGKAISYAQKSKPGSAATRSSKKARQQRQHTDDVKSESHELIASRDDADKNQTSSQQREQYQSEVKQIQKSLMSEKGQLQGEAARNVVGKAKTMSDCSTTVFKNKLRNRIEPLNAQSKKFIMSQVDKHEYLTMQADGEDTKNNMNQINNSNEEGPLTNLALGGGLCSPLLSENGENGETGGVGAEQKISQQSDVHDQSGLDRDGASILDSYQDSQAENAADNICTQIATQALSNSYNIEPLQAQQIISDTRKLINHYREQKTLRGEPKWNKRVTLSPYESSAFYNTISDRFDQNSAQIIENESDLKPILSMILLGIQDYQSEETQMDSLKCIKFMVGMNSGYFREKIWDWAKSTSIQVKRQGSGANKGFAKKQNEDAKQLQIVGFIQCIQDLMSLPDSSELSQLACRTLVLIAQKQFYELFMGQLPSLSTDRVQYLSMMNENFQLFHSEMLEQVDEVERVPLLNQFVDLGIPNFLAAQCLCLIESSIMQQKETQLDRSILNNIEQQSSKTSESNSGIQDQHTVAIALLSEIWLHMPALFSDKQPQTASMVQLDLEDILTQQFKSQQHEQKNRLLGTKVLSLFIKISSDASRSNFGGGSWFQGPMAVPKLYNKASLTVRVLLISRLFAILEKLANEGDHFAETIYRLLIFFLVEWHDNQILRQHLLTNFIDLFSQEKVLSLNQLVEPLCSVITMNLQKDKVDERRYLTMNDYSFFWALAHENRITANDAQAICKIMQKSMLKRDPHFLVAEKIFFKLTTKFANEQPICALLTEYVSQAIEQLASVDNQIKTNKLIQPLTTPRTGRQAIEDKRNTDKFEQQMQLHYLFKHLLMLARGKRAAGQQMINEEELPLEAAAFRDLYDHMVAALQNKIQSTPTENQSDALASLLKKLLESKEMMEARNKGLTKPNILSDSFEMDLNNAGVPSVNILEEDQIEKMKQQKFLASNKQSHETLLFNRVQSHKTLLFKRGEEEQQPAEPEQVLGDVPDGDILSSVTYIASHHHATINSASRVFSHVDRVEREANKMKRSVADLLIPEEEASEHHVTSKPPQMCEMGTDYDPPTISSTKSHRSRHSILEDKDNNIAMQTEPKKHNKKLQVTIQDETYSKSSIGGEDNDDVGVQTSTDLIMKPFARAQSVRIDSQPDVLNRKEDVISVVQHEDISESDQQYTEACSKDLTYLGEDVILNLPHQIFQIDEDEAEQQLSPQEDQVPSHFSQQPSPTREEKVPSSNHSRRNQSAKGQSSQTLRNEKIDAYLSQPYQPSQEASKLKIKAHQSQRSAQSYRKKTSKTQSQQTEILPTRNMTAKIDVHNALEQIKQNLDNFTANLKNESQFAPMDQGTASFRAETQMSDLKMLSERGENEPTDQLESKNQRRYSRVKDFDYNATPGYRRTIVQKPIQRFDSNNRVLVNLNDQEARRRAYQSKFLLGKARNITQQCKLCFAQGINQSSHETDACPHPFQKITLLTSPERESQQEYGMLGQRNLNSTSSTLLKIQNPHDTLKNRNRADALKKFGSSSSLDGSQSCKVLSINRLPEIASSKKQEPTRKQPNRLSLKNSNTGSKLDNQFAFKRAPAQQFDGVPISLPKMSDFWRGNSYEPTQYDHSIIQSARGVPAPMAPSPEKFSPSHMVRHRTLTTISDQHDDELSLMYAQYQLNLQEKKRLLKHDLSPVRALTNLSPSHRTSSKLVHRAADQEESSPQNLRKSGYSWISNKVPAAPETAQKLVHNSQQREKEVKRLEDALECLMINLGSEVGPSRFKSRIDEDSDPEEKLKLAKTYIEDNKHTNIMVSQIEIENVDLTEPQIESQDAMLPNGYLDSGAGLVSPLETEMLVEDQIDIVNTPTFDPEHSGLEILSPNQVKQLKGLADRRDNDEHMSPDENQNLDNLLSLLENGTPIDGGHSGMVNLTPEQQSQLIKLNQADKNDRTPLNPDQKRQLDNLKNLIVHGIPLDSKHPGCINLSPNQKKHLIAIENKQAKAQPLKPAEEDQLGQYKNIIAHGEPINSSHPGVVNLTETEKYQQIILEDKPDETLSPVNLSLLDSIRNTIVEGIPLDEKHPDVLNMAPFELKRFKELERVRDDRDLEPEEKKEMTILQEKLKSGNPIDERHPGMVNLTPIQQDQAKSLIQQEQDGIPIAREAQNRLNELKDQIIQGRPLDANHPGMSHLTPNQIDKLKSILRKKSNGEPLLPDDKNILQKIQNLMQRGCPMDHENPGFKMMKPNDQDQYMLLQSLREGGRNLSPESSTKFEKLANTIQLNSGPYDQSHEGFHNLVPSEQDHLKIILSKQASQVPLSNQEKDDLGRIKEQMRPYVPYDRLHPGYDGLTPQEQLKLNAINTKIDSGVDLTPNYQVDLQKIKDKMNNPVGIDETHPGWNYLIPREKLRFKMIRDKEDCGQRVSPEEDKYIGSLKNIIQNGRPIDEHHPGIENLNPEQQKRFKELSQFKQNGKQMTPDERGEKNKLDDNIVNGVPIGVEHPGFKGLDPDQKRRFKNLSSQRNDRSLSPVEKKEFDQLLTNISPSLFSPDLAAALKSLQKKQHRQGDLNPEEWDQKERLEELKKNLPHIIENQLSPEQKALLSKYLQMLLFEQPMSPAQKEELAFLLGKDKDIERNLTPEEQQRIKELVIMQYRGAVLEPQEQKELNYLHRKQNDGIGGLTPGQYSVLQKLQDFQEMGQPISNEMQQSLEFLLQLQALPSQLNPSNEAELGEMEAKNKLNDITPAVKNRLKAFWRMRYHPQLLNPQDRALFYAMKDLESLPTLSPDQENMLFALQKKFNCLPNISPAQEIQMNRLEIDNKMGQLSAEQKRDLDRLRQLPKPELVESDIPGLTAADCRDYKLLKAKRDRFEAMTPEEMARYRDLKDKQKRFQDKEVKANLLSPRNGPPSARSANQKTPDAQGPSARSANQKTPDAQGGFETQRSYNPKAVTDISEGGDLSPAGFFGGNPDRQNSQIQFKRAMRSGTCTLKELVDQFFIIEQQYTIKAYQKGIDTTFQFSQATGKGKGSLDKHSLLPLTLKDFMHYAKAKKIKYKEQNVVEILRDESRSDDISKNSFVKLLILASCGGDKQKIGISNFKKLMVHMDIFK